MPPKGFVGLEVTPQRKLMLNEIMQGNSFSKPSEAIDFVLALAGDYVHANPDEVEQTELPKFLNYYIGDTTGISKKDSVGPLVEAERTNQMVSALTWRASALNVIRNFEPTIITLSDAFDFAMSAYLIQSRSGSIAPERIAAVKAEVKANQVRFKDEVRAFLQDNMQDQEAAAREAGTKNKRKTEKKANARIESVETMLEAITNMKHTKPDETCKACEAAMSLAVAAGKAHTIFTTEIKRINKDGTENTERRVNEALPF